MSEISKLLEPNNILLRTTMELSEDCDREKVKQDLIDSMEHYQGVGLSANQIGIPERVFIMYEDVNTRKILTCFNPKILELSKEQILMDEGCLTYPGIWLKVKRPYAVKFEYEDEKREKHEKEFIGLPSRIFQHEYDHMLGRTFTEYASKMKLDMAYKKAQKMMNKYSKKKK